MNRSSNASRYGSLAERKLCESRGLIREGKHTSWCDAEFKNGTPVEIKAGMVSTGYWQIYEKYHNELRNHDGWYGFVVYKPVGRGIRVLKERMVHSSNLPPLKWSNTNHEQRKSRKAVARFEQIFD